MLGFIEKMLFRRAFAPRAPRGAVSESSSSSVGKVMTLVLSLGVDVSG